MARYTEANISKWADKIVGRMDDLIRQSAQEVFEIAQTPSAQGGRMPVDTGFLRNSLVTSLNGSTSLSGAASYVMTIAGARAGDVIFGGWGAEYAVDQEFGSRGRAGKFFMRSAASEWNRIVQENARRLAR